MEDGRALDPAYITRTFAKFRKQGELLPPLTPHGLRHTFTSLGLEEGIDISILSKVLGHKSVQTTADIYAHLTEGAGQKAVDGVADRIAHTLLTSEGVST